MTTPSDPTAPAPGPGSGSAEPKSPYDDHRRPILRGVKFGVIGLIIVTVASLAIWGWLQGLPGIWGVLMGAAIGGGYVLLTALSVLITANTSTGFTGVVVLGGWLVKLAAVLLIFVAIDGLTFYHTTAFVVTLLIALFVVIGSELYGVISTNVTFTG